MCSPRAGGWAAPFAVLLALSGCEQAPSPDRQESPDKGPVLFNVGSGFHGFSDSCPASSSKPTDVRDCYPMQQSRRWSGLWRAEFEGSQFCPAPAESCTFDSASDRIWLSFAPEIPGGAPEIAWEEGALYAIEFVGRRTEQRGQHGHLGVSDHEIVVEELIDLRRVEEPGWP